jgi:mRNA-degrading endonuclease RelE of RelBE toxin-antitoxin system|tara:strand:+ start:57 stop:269 length:213 start_codon:yes stop_codon:yes gene_type:complete
MTWEVIISRSAARALKTAPKNDRARILSALGGMEANPYAGDIAALRGVYKGAFRRRVGSWRLLFDVDATA